MVGRDLRMERGSGGMDESTSRRSSRSGAELWRQVPRLVGSAASERTPTPHRTQVAPGGSWHEGSRENRTTTAVPEDPLPAPPSQEGRQHSRAAMEPLLSSSRSAEHTGHGVGIRALGTMSRVVARLKRAHSATEKDRKRLFDSAKAAARLRNDPNLWEERMYNDSGFCVEVATHPRFRSLAQVAVLLSTLWLGVETNYDEEADLYNGCFLVVDWTFCVFFSLEIAIRIGALKQKCVVLQSPLLLLDILLAFIMNWETWLKHMLAGYVTASHGGQWLSLRILRIMRILRFGRFRKLWEAMPELLTFVEGISHGMRAVATGLLMLIAIIYVFGIIFTSLLGDTEAGHGCFDTVLTSMNFLFITAVCSIDKNFIMKMQEAGWFFWLLWLFYLLVANLTVMRLLTGVILTQTNEVHSQYRDRGKRLAMEQELHELLDQLDEQHNGKISQKAFRRLFENPSLLERLATLEVDLKTFMDATLESWPDHDLSINYIVEKAFHFRASNHATFRDIIESRRTQEKILAKLLGSDNAFPGEATWGSLTGSCSS